MTIKKESVPRVTILSEDLGLPRGVIWDYLVRWDNGWSEKSGWIASIYHDTLWIQGDWRLQEPWIARS